MIRLKILANVLVEGATSEEEAIEVVMGLGSEPVMESITRGGSDESPVYSVKIRGEESFPKKEVDEEAPPGGEAEKEEFKEVKDEQSEDSK